MTMAMEKPQSKKARSFNRFSGTQDHGTRGNAYKMPSDVHLDDDLWDFAPNYRQTKENLATFGVKKGTRGTRAYRELRAGETDAGQRHDLDEESRDVVEFNELYDRMSGFDTVSAEFLDRVDEFYKGILDIDDLVTFYRAELERNEKQTVSYDDAETYLYEFLHEYRKHQRQNEQRVERGLAAAAWPKMYDGMSSSELEAAADEILDDYNERNYSYGYYDEDENKYFSPEENYSDNLKSLQNELKGLKYQLSILPKYTPYKGRDVYHRANEEIIDQQRLTLEAKIDDVVAVIRELLGENGYPEAAMNIESRREKRNREARDATLDDFSEDDFGDDNRKYESGNHIR